MKRRRPCANPLFEKWLEEWKDFAVQKDSPLQHSYGKALASLRQYPLPLESGKECFLICNFGPKLCSMLDKRLEQYRAENNLPAISFEIPAVFTKSDFPNHNETEGKAQKIDNQNAKAKQKDDAGKSKKTKKTVVSPSGSSKPYIPKVGSAAYAILVTLYKKSLEPTHPGYMYKKDIITEAQSDCDCKMKSNALQHYVGWSSMSILIEKNLVKRKSCPAKFSLTDSGLALAVLLCEGKSTQQINIDEDANVNNSSFLLSTSKINGYKSSRPKSSESKPFEENLNNQENDIVELLDDYDDDVFKENSKETENAKLDLCEKARNKELDEVKTKSASNSDDDYDKFCKENPEPIITIKRKEQHFLFTEVIDKPLNEINNKADFQSLIAESQKKTETVKGNVKVVKSNQQKKNSVDETPSESFYLLANNFDVLLLVDTQETCGGKTKPKDDATISELSKSGILYEVRSLKVGDFLWIARCRLTKRELVLPYIIERKRLDDLSSSIKDGRYHEQKFRLRQSGVENVIYMIENYGSNVHGSIPLTSLMQAAANSAVQDGFSVKFTKDHKDSMLYLSTMTTMLTKKYEVKELWGGLKKDLQPGLLIEFNDFNKAAVKTKNYKVKQMLIRQLLQLKGVSVDKAVAIAELYPTPKILAEALRQADDKLLANIESGPSKRKLGPTISKTFHQLYTKYDLL